MDELLSFEERKKLSFLIPGRDTTTTSSRNRARTGPNRFGGGYKSRVNHAESKVDSGLRRARQLAEMRLAALGKENIPGIKLVPTTTTKKVRAHRMYKYSYLSLN